MYRRPKFLEILLTIRQEMAAEADHDVHLFAEFVRSGRQPEARSRTVSRSSDEPLDETTTAERRKSLRRPLAKK